ncbi:MAG: hypothetical protein ACRYGI_18320 [Janthinobacterium lividum]
MQEIVEIYQDEMAAHIYRRETYETWSFTAIDGAGATLGLRSIGLEIPLAEIYEFALLAQAASFRPVMAAIRRGPE